MSTILTTSPTFASIGDIAKEIEAEGFTLRRHTKVDNGYQESLRDAEYLVAGLVPVTAETISSAPRLKGILKHGVGLDSIDIVAATAVGIPVTSTPGANAQAVAEMAFGAIFALSRNTVAGHMTVLSGHWERRRGSEVAGKTLGLVGFGQIGQRLARMARGIGMHLLAYDPFPALDAVAELSVELVKITDLLARSDIVSLHLPGNADTNGLIDEAALARMKHGALLLNFARGSLVDLDALTQALEDGHLAGAAIDAYPIEPPDVSHPVFAAPNVLFSPHSGADTTQSIQRMSRMVLEDIRTIDRNEWPARAVNPEPSAHPSR